MDTHLWVTITQIWKASDSGRQDTGRNFCEANHITLGSFIHAFVDHFGYANLRVTTARSMSLTSSGLDRYVTFVTSVRANLTFYFI